MKLLLDLKDKELPSDISKIRVREASRAVAFDEHQLVPLIFVSSTGYSKLPGGGIEKGEDKLSAVVREVKEETGSVIEVGKELGMVTEYRSKYDMTQTSYCYLAKVISKGEPEFTESEKSRGFELVWLSLDDAISKIEKSDSDNYESTFTRPRDIAFLKEAKKMIESSK